LLLSTYDYLPTAYEAIDLVPGAPDVVNVVDGSATSASIPLGSNTFRFYGVSYTGSAALYAYVNGFLALGGSDTNWSNQDLTNTPSRAAVAPMWDSWTVSSGTDSCVLYKFDGDRLIVEWNQVPNTFYSGSGSTPATFQAILRLNTGAADGDITFNYPDLDVGSASYNNGASATVGIKATGTQGPNRVVVSYNSGTNALLGSGKAVKVSADTGIDYYPHVDLVDVTPDPNATHLDSVTVRFSEPVNGFGLANLTLVRNGNVTVPLAGDY
jgi:hypothetical protein